MAAFAGLQRDQWRAVGNAHGNTGVRVAAPSTWHEWTASGMSRWPVAGGRCLRPGERAPPERRRPGVGLYPAGSWAARRLGCRNSWPKAYRPVAVRQAKCPAPLPGQARHHAGACSQLRDFCHSVPGVDRGGNISQPTVAVWTRGYIGEPAQLRLQLAWPWRAAAAGLHAGQAGRAIDVESTAGLHPGHGGRHPARKPASLRYHAGPPGCALPRAPGGSRIRKTSSAANSTPRK